MRSAVVHLRQGLGIVNPLGWTVLGAGCVLGFAAATTGWLELAVLAAACLLVFLLATPFLVGRTRVQVDVVLQPERVIAGGSVAAGVRVRNIASHGLLPTTLELPVGSIVHRYAVPRLRPDETHEETFTIRTERRGVIPVGPATTRRGDPLALLSRDVAWTDVTEILVRPPMVPMDSLGAGLLRDLEGVSTDAVSQSDLAFHALREYVPGDDLRHVHWRSSAKAMAVADDTRLLVRQYLDTRRSHVTLVVDDTPAVWTDARRLRDRDVGRRVDHRARDPRRVRHLVRLRRQRLLRRHRPPGPRLRLPGRARAPRPGRVGAPGGRGVARHQPAVPGRRGGHGLRELPAGGRGLPAGGTPLRPDRRPVAARAGSPRPGAWSSCRSPTRPTSAPCSGGPNDEGRDEVPPQADPQPGAHRRDRRRVPAGPDRRRAGSGSARRTPRREFWWIGMLGALLAVLDARSRWRVMLRWPSVVAAVASWSPGSSCSARVLALRQQASACPTPESWRLLVDEALFGWKDLLTTLPPVDGESRLLVLPWRARPGRPGCSAPSLIAGAQPPYGARRRRCRCCRRWPCSALVILLGVTRPHSLWLQGVAFAVLALAWLGLRFARDAAPVRSAQGKLARLGAGAALVARGRAAGPARRHLGARRRRGPGGPAHLRRPAVRRRAVPLPAGVVPQVRQAAGRCEATRRTSTTPTLFSIEGVPAGSRVRLAVLDRYDGVVWGASNDAQPGRQPTTPTSGSRRVIDNPVARQVGRRPGHHRARAGAGSGCPRSARCRPCTSTRADRQRLSRVLPLQPGHLLRRGAGGTAARRRLHVHRRAARRTRSPPRRCRRATSARPPTRRGFLDTQAVQWSEGESQPMRRVFAIARHLKSEGKYSDGVVAEREDLPRRPQPVPAHRRHRRGEHALRGRQRRAVRRVDGAAGQPDRRAGPGRVRRGRPRRRGRHRCRRARLGRGAGRGRVLDDAGDRPVHGQGQAGEAAGRPAADR